MSKDTLPQKGGSFVKDKKGDLRQVAGTAQPDPNKPAAEPVSEAPSKED
jgi:hypothetical protein